MPRPRHRIFRRTTRFDDLPDHFPDYRMRPVSATRKTGRYSPPEDRSDTRSFPKTGDRRRRTRRIERQQTERHRSFDGHRMLRHGRPACDDRTRPYARPRAACPNRLLPSEPGPIVREAGGTNFPSTHENTELPSPKNGLPNDRFRNPYRRSATGSFCPQRTSARADRRSGARENLPDRPIALPRKADTILSPFRVPRRKTASALLRERTAQLHDEKRRKRKFPERNFRFRC